MAYISHFFVFRSLVKVIARHGMLRVDLPHMKNTQQITIIWETVVDDTNNTALLKVFQILLDDTQPT